MKIIVNLCNSVMCLCLILMISVRAYINIEDYGAISDKMNPVIAEKNSRSIEKAFQVAYTTKDRAVYVPNNTYYISAIEICDLNGIYFTINGTLKAHDFIKKWPKDDDGVRKHIMNFVNMNQFTINGCGTIDGQGYKWWWMAVLSATGKTSDDRPHMINIEKSVDFELNGITMINSPRFHVKLHDLYNVYMHHFEIDVDVVSQKNIFKQYNVPMFPLNTDGVDPYAVNVKINNFKIRNYDDAIAVKPCNGGYKYCTCSSNMLITDGIVYESVGLTIGSVPPNDDVACIKNVVFKNITMINPLKGIYVKTNRGTHGNGTISNIRYENIYMDTPIWWGIYIGPQQQSQPDGSGEGCMRYPADPDCPTEPAITLSNIYLKNITVQNSVNPYAGIIRCNETNPCEDFTFEDVIVSSIAPMRDYICEFIDMKSINSFPVPCIDYK